MRDGDGDDEIEADVDAGSRTAGGVPRLDEDHGEILRLLIGHEAKDPGIDPILKLKLITLGSRLGDNVREAIATHAHHFGGQG